MLLWQRKQNNIFVHIGNLMESEHFKNRGRRITGTLILFALERLLKWGTVAHFFAQTAPSDPPSWPSVTILQPITRGASGLFHNLSTRAWLDYPGEIQHLLICDSADSETQSVCYAYLAAHTHLSAEVILTKSMRSELASKIEKLLAALPNAHGDVLCFLDDDIALRPDALRILVPALLQTSAGAVFGLAYYTNWETTWSSLMSLFVNTNALLSYIPLSYMTEPFTITGHCFALRRTIFEQAGGFSQLEKRIDDDHELARRVRKLGLHCVQTRLIYDVNNKLPSLRAYLLQIKRWFVLPGQSMLPYLTSKELFVSLLGSFGNLLPGILLLNAILTRKKRAWQSVGLALTLSSTIYALCEQWYLSRSTPLKGWLLLPFVVLLSPFQALAALLSNHEIEWRGQSWHIARGGHMMRSRTTKHALNTFNKD
jgi:ceramide glucosyltransferase